MAIEAAKLNPTVHVPPSIHDVWYNTFHTDEVKFNFLACL